MSHTNQPLFLATAYDALSILRKQITDIEEQNKTLGKRLNHALSLVYNISSQKKSKRQHSKFGREKNNDIQQDNTNEIEKAKKLLNQYNIITNDDIAKAMKPVPELLFDEGDIRKTMSQIQSKDWEKQFELSSEYKNISAKLYKAGHLE
jgi:Cft2 family RNA processing exonuclease